ncbi:MAG: 3D-(3,5/4)-trihydroxycyclohexane-1,2-dione acylhydrolase (decyclizing) [Candidatus Marinimicrobia bacterium]|nr:3D-(3,5/4)-trihydroxycyclohexane-1,2-dione acylhydrolase (decyclizing) [Candidatus Neomarinimicrobiota bacterium]|tara:strand:+ start:16255 stop:18099 length:1845 start_codon:yes stop_codon:yes gene_type:complete
MKTIRMSCAHALFKYLINQKTLIDGNKVALFPGAFGIYGHGNVACIGQAMEEFQSDLPGYRGHHEQNMALSAIGYARAMRRKQIFIATSSVGPGSTNMVTAAAVALSNRLPLLLIPGDTFASRFPDPVLQQVENFNSPTETQNDSFKSVSKYFDRITRPEQILSSLPQAIQIMLDPAECGPATISMSQDVQGEAFDFPEIFFEEKIHEIRRVYPDPRQISKAAENIKNSKQPIIIAGGGVLYSEAEKELSEFAKKHNVPVMTTVMGIGCMKREDPYYIGAIGCLGEGSSNNLSKDTDMAIAIGTKLGDFTTGSWTNFENSEFQLVSINAARFDVTKHRATPVISDAKIGLKELSNILGEWKAPELWYQRALRERKEWDLYVEKQSGPTNQETPSYAHAVGAIYRNADKSDIVVTAAGGLVGEVVQIWKPKQLNTFETEWGFSCMGYEISGALGIKMAKPDQDVVVFVGDGSYLLHNSDIYSSVLYDKKLIIILCDNGGHMVINRLQLAKGGKEYLCNLRSAKASNMQFVNFEAHAKSMGANAETVKSTSELEAAFKRAKKSNKTYVISIETHGYEWLEGTAFWESPTLEIPTTKENKKAYTEYIDGKKKQRKGV